MPRCAKFAMAVKEHGGRRPTAESLGCSVEFVRLLISGQKTPGLGLALKIEEVLGISVSYWKDRTATNENQSKAAS